MEVKKIIQYVVKNVLIIFIINILRFYLFNDRSVDYLTGTLAIYFMTQYDIESYKKRINPITI